MPKLSTFYGSNPVVVNAQPMSLGKYNDFRGWELPSNENANDEGYLIECLNENPNTAEYNGYVTWASKSQFEHSFSADGCLSCGHALELLSYSSDVVLTRKGWGGGERLVMDSGVVSIKKSTGDVVAWTPSNEDMTARDYVTISNGGV